MDDKPYGLSSQQIVKQRNQMVACYGGGSMANCLKGVYQQDYVLDAKLHDARQHDLKQMTSSFEKRHKTASINAQKRLQTGTQRRQLLIIKTDK